jgi:lysozyme
MSRSLGLVVLALAACEVEETQSQITSALYTQQCPTTTVEGVDVYSGTGVINWTRLKSSGRQFAFIKATQGDYNRQATFKTQWDGAAAAGVLRSPYHFFDGTIDGVAQATVFLDEIAQAGGLQPTDLPPMLDIECPTSSNQAASQSNCEHAGDSGWVATATLSQRIFDWLAAVEQATGRAPILYSYPSWFASVGVTDVRLAAYPLFVASYNTCASVPAPWTQTVFWQYSATGTVPGIAGTGNADVDRFVGSDGDLVNLTAVTPDAGAVAGDAAASGDAGIAPPTPAGCGCQADGGPGWWLVPALVALMLFTRRRARSPRH